MEIVKLTKKDISQIRPMWEELNNIHGKLSTNFKEHFESFTFEKRLKQIEEKESYSVFVAKDGSNYVGYSIASINSKIVEIYSIYIKPQNRNNKAGESLIASAESWLKSKGINKIHVLVAEGNESVLGFYNKQGYYKKYTVLEKKAKIPYSID
jgi:ribosomal protein S18 acetylase RimI-like enzyme